MDNAHRASKLRLVTLSDGDKLSHSTTDIVLSLRGCPAEIELNRPLGSLVPISSNQRPGQVIRIDVDLNVNHPGDPISPISSNQRTDKVVRIHFAPNKRLPRHRQRCRFPTRYARA